MSGHSKWHSIKHKKGVADAKKGKIFTKHAQLIALAARSGGDPALNPSLRLAIDNAKADNTPNLNVERAIKRGTGELKDGTEIQEILYEGYGPEGTALMIACVTDNKNRTVSQVKSILTKHGGNMGTTGSVAYMFKRSGFLTANTDSISNDDAEMAIIESGAEDFEKTGDNTYAVYCTADNLNQVKENLEKASFRVEKTEITFLPQNTILISDSSRAKKMLNLMEKIDELEDVVNVYSNFDIPENIMESME